LNDVVSVWRDEERWTYFVGIHPIYAHPAGDKCQFRLVTAQLIDAGLCRQVEIIKTFGVSKSSVTRALKKLRNEGPPGFFQPRKGRRRGNVLTPDVLSRAQQLLDDGYTRRQTSEDLDVPYDTLRKAINVGRLVERQTMECQQATDKSSRSAVDADAATGMGTACTRVVERVLAATGKLGGGVSEHFEPCHDVPGAGVLCALPALISNGLLDGLNCLGKVKGYYTRMQIIILLAFMALWRIRTVEQLRGKPPGEFGKVMGLDRIPEVRCLRKKLDTLSDNNAAEEWAAHLSRQWMHNDPDAAGTLYVDGHVRVYNGKQTKPPRRYVSRSRLCLRGITDYWVNDAIGRPFFVVEKTIDPGMLNVLRDDIVPRLLREVPGQPTDEQLSADRYECRFVLVFDREGYSPAFFAEMWQQHRIACITYHKFPREKWPEEWFTETQLHMPGGETVTTRLAEMGSLIGSGDKKLWVREIRKLTDNGHQTSLISTAYKLDNSSLATRMFTRWCQENFFRYMLQHFDLDALNEHGTCDLSGTEKVVNPTWRELDRNKRSVTAKLANRQAKFAAQTLHPASEDKPIQYKKWQCRKAQLLEEVEHYENELEQLKASIKQTPRHIQSSELPEEHKFQHLASGRKRLIDTVRMIAYRAETAMVQMVRCQTVDSAAGRRLMQDLFNYDADILPDQTAQRLLVRVHGSARPATDRQLATLFEDLNAAELMYPGTQLQLTYELVGLTSASAEDGVT